MDSLGLLAMDCTYCWCLPCICGRYDERGRPRNYPGDVDSFAGELTPPDFLYRPESKEDRVLRLLEEIGKLIREK